MNQLFHLLKFTCSIISHHMRIFQNRPSKQFGRISSIQLWQVCSRPGFPAREELPWQRAGCNHWDGGAFGQKAGRSHQPRLPKQCVVATCPQAAGGVQWWQLTAQMPSLGHQRQPSTCSILLAIPHKYDSCLLWQLSSRL